MLNGNGGIQRKRKHSGRHAAVKWICFAFMVALTFFGMVYGKTRLKSVLVIEAGSPLPSVDDFLLWNYRDAKLVSGLDDPVGTRKTGDYPVTVAISGRLYSSTLRVVDTVSPRVKVGRVTVFTTREVLPADLLQGVDDATRVTVKYEEEPDFKTPGDIEVNLIVTDEAGNLTRVMVPVSVINDKTPPKIIGVGEITVRAGESVSYKRGVTVTDDYDKNAELVVDASGVDIYTVGDYTVKYTAADAAGNQSEAETAVHVQPAGAEYATEDLVYALADRVLAEITVPDMSQYDKAKAIIVWVKKSIYYFSESPHDSPIKGAYRGLYEKKGDCYAYTMASQYLLTRAGIKNMVVYAAKPSAHCWNIIDIGEGWHHFDSTDGLTSFYVTDERFKKIGNQYRRHEYDVSKYPEIR